MAGPNGNTRDRLDLLERELQQVRRQLNQQPCREASAGSPRQVRLVKTVAISGSYPTEPADTFGIVFCDTTFTQTAGNNGHTNTDRQSTFAAYAHSMSGKYYPVGSLAFVERQNHKWVFIEALNTQMIPFELTADLVYGVAPAADNAKILEWNGTTWLVGSTAIRVFDWGNSGGTYGNWVGRAPAGAVKGYQGICIKASSGRYEIIWMEEQARFIKFKLSSQLKYNAASVGASQVENWDGRTPPVGSVTVYNTETDLAGTYQFWGPSDAVGYAVFDDKLGRYRIIWLETQAKYIEFTLASATAGTAAFSAGTATGATVNNWWDGKKFWGGTTRDIQDPQGLFVRALQGGKGIARWNEAYDGGNGGYEAIECQSKAGWIDFTLTTGFSSLISTGATVNDYGGSQQDVQNPGSAVSVHDDQSLFVGKTTGDKGRAIYDAVEDKYRIVTMKSGTSDPAHGCRRVTGTTITGGAGATDLTFTDVDGLVGMTNKTTTPNGLQADKDGYYLFGFNASVVMTSPSGTADGGGVVATLFKNGAALSHDPLSTVRVFSIGGTGISVSMAITHIEYMSAGDYVSVSMYSVTSDVLVTAGLTAVFLSP